VSRKSVSWKKRLRRWWAEYQWVIIGIAGFLILCLGYLGFKNLYANASVERTPFDLFYLTLQLFRISSVVPPGQKPLELEIARNLATILTLLTAANTLLLLFREKFQSLRLIFWHKHNIICGLGTKGRELAGDLLEKGELVCIIECDETNDEINNFRRKGAIVIVGNATSSSRLQKARAAKARYVFAASGEDRINLEIGFLAHKMMGRGAFFPERCCFVHLIDLELRSLLERQHLSSDEGSDISIKFFNIFENSARRLFLDHPPDIMMKKSGRDRAHLLIVGFGRMGQAVTLQAAKTGHFANGKQVRITVVDRSAARKGETFLHKHPMIQKLLNIAFVTLDTDNIDFLNGTFLKEHGGTDSVTQMIICLEQESAGLLCSLSLSKLFGKKNRPISIRLNMKSELAELHPASLNTFGNMDNSCSSDMVLGEEQDKLARMVHAGYIRVRKRQPDCDDSDPSIQAWENLDEDLKESNRCQAEHLDIKLRAIGCRRVADDPQEKDDFSFSVDEIELLAKMEHARWVGERLLAGWIYGELKIIENKISPYLVSWDTLSEEIKEYDRSAVRNIPLVLREIGQRIARG
jgi:hypothetical protein